MATLKAVIVEDEIESRQLLKSIIENFTSDVEVINEAEGVEAGLKIIKEESPDIVFLDIQLKDGSGFDLLDAFGALDFHLIFVTAYDEHAVKAFKYSAFDYLLKPIDIDKLEHCVSRIKTLRRIERQKIKFLKSVLISKDTPPDKILINLADGHKILRFSDILAIQGIKNYVHFIMVDGSKHLASKAIGHYEDLLPITTFYRIHKSHFINIDKISEIKSGRISTAIMNNGSEYDIAARRKVHFLEYLRTKK